MPTMQPPTVSDWQAVITAIARSKSDKDGKIERRRAFDAAQALLRGSIEGQARAKKRPFGELRKSTTTVANEAKKFPAITNFLKTLRSFRLESLGVHVVDPIAGRLSAIWTHVKSPTAKKLAEAELYARAWNRIYRRLFRPSATLINAIESGVLPWQWDNIRLPTVAASGERNKGWYSGPFFRDTQRLARELQNTIRNSIPKNPDPSNSRHVEAVVQSTWNELEKSDFIVRLDRIAARFRDEIIDDHQKKIALCDYLRKCAGDILPLDLKTKMTTNAGRWNRILDIVQALQSSVLSYPEFCGKHGLWVHRVEFCNSPLPNRTSIYFIFGLTRELKDASDLFDLAKESFNNLGKALDSLIEMPIPVVASPSDLVKSLFQEIKKHQTNIEYHENGLQRWLCAVERLMKEAKHEGHPITYNVGYGSLAYAQSHLHRYEPAPDDLSDYDVRDENIASYIKGFYSIFGRTDRGLWFDELGRYCGVFENADNRAFEKTTLNSEVHSQHESTVLFAKIGGVGLVDILHRTTNQIARVKNGELVDMVRGDERRTKAMETLALAKANIIPNKYREIAKWLVNELVEMLQAGTHGTSFIISFSHRSPSRRTREWRSGIEAQTKTLIRNFRKLEAPLATHKQLSGYATEWINSLRQRKPQLYSRPLLLFNFLTELANLDGGLWLQLSENKGLEVRAAQQFIPLLQLGSKGIRPLDLQMNPKLLAAEAVSKDFLPDSELKSFEALKGVKSYFAAINGRLVVEEPEKKKYVEALSFLHHSGTKTHSLWGMSLTAAEPCLCVVISSDGKVYIFHDGREFARP